MPVCPSSQTSAGVASGVGVGWGVAEGTCEEGVDVEDAGIVVDGGEDDVDVDVDGFRAEPSSVGDVDDDNDDGGNGGACVRIGSRCVQCGKVDMHTVRTTYEQK